MGCYSFGEIETIVVPHLEFKRNLKVAKAGDTVTVALAMSNNKVTGLAGPTAEQDAATKDYIDTVVRGSLKAIIIAGQSNTLRASDWFKTATIPSVPAGTENRSIWQRGRDRTITCLIQQAELSNRFFGAWNTAKASALANPAPITDPILIVWQ